MNLRLADNSLGITAPPLALMAAFFLGAVNYCMRQGQGSLAYFIGGLVGWPACARTPTRSNLGG